MKKLIFAAVILVSCLSAKIASAQVRLSVNIGSQPEWGPVGYDHADYYYMPDIDAYYDVNAHLYYFVSHNTWVHAEVLPPRFSNYDIYHSYKVVVNEPNPWVHADIMRRRYAQYRGRHDQTIIRESRDVRYRTHYVERRDHRYDHGHRG